MFRAELVEGLEGLLVNDGALFNPADLVLLGLDPEEAAAVFEDFERLAVDDLGDAVADGGDAVMQVHLPGRDVDGVVMLAAEAVAGGERKEEPDEEQRCGRSVEASCRCGG